MTLRRQKPGDSERHAADMLFDYMRQTSFFSGEIDNIHAELEALKIRNPASAKDLQAIINASDAPLDLGHKDTPIIFVTPED